MQHLGAYDTSHQDEAANWDDADEAELIATANTISPKEAALEAIMVYKAAMQADEVAAGGSNLGGQTILDI